MGDSHRERDATVRALALRCREQGVRRVSLVKLRALMDAELVMLSEDVMRQTIQPYTTLDDLIDDLRRLR